MTGEHSQPGVLTSDQSLEVRLNELCTCMAAGDNPCIFCEARQRIEAQDRTLRLAQETMANQQRRISRLEDRGDAC